MISTKPGLNRFLRITPGGLLRIDAAKVAADAKLDGKYLLRTCDPHLSHRGHRAGLQAAARGRTRLAGHEAGPGPAPGLSTGSRTASAPTSLLCWLALLLARIVETRATTPDGQATTWPRARDELQRLHVGTFTGPAGMFRQTTAPTAEARRLHTALDLPLPPRILHLDTDAAATR